MNTPIKSYYEDKISFYLLNFASKFVKIYSKLNKATLDDDYMMIKSTKNQEFFSVDNIRNDIGAYGSDFVAQALILMDSNRDIYQRSVFTILDLFGTIGGIFGLLTSAFGFLLSMITTQIMMSSVFRRLYYSCEELIRIIFKLHLFYKCKYTIFLYMILIFLLKLENISNLGPILNYFCMSFLYQH